MSALTDRAAEIHVDSVQDTGVCYSTFQGWVLTCSWCGYPARAATKVAALPLMQEHYDRVCGNGRVVVAAERVS